MKFEKKRASAKTEISTASMPDIIFMLLLFFMVATTMREQEIFVKFILPEAQSVQKIENKRLVSYIWIGDNERIQIDDNIVPIKKVQDIMYDKRVNLPSVIVSLRADKNSRMGLITDIQQSLRKADARRINYSATAKM
ncbi:MAG: biopolymer transporter ExbD [Ignavibacteriae bacterium]|nr:biopolymer transporter ExbD [Ignavibacteriota bacterium]MCB0751386.1 biopolymer transporter ExbD [Ignavibacteriota bacterium]MCB9250073.1 biopolymer transporter ExbD [Ignavibacteriales bacterium]